MATIAASRLTSKYQAAIPADVRRALRLKLGDVVQFEIDGGRVTLRRQSAVERSLRTAVAR